MGAPIVLFTIGALLWSHGVTTFSYERSFVGAALTISGVIWALIALVID